MASQERGVKRILTLFVNSSIPARMEVHAVKVSAQALHACVLMALMEECVKMTFLSARPQLVAMVARVWKVLEQLQAAFVLMPLQGNDVKRTLILSAYSLTLVEMEAHA